MPSKRVFSAFLLLLAVPSPLSAQKEQKKKPDYVITPVGKVRILDDTEARKLVSRVRKLVLSKKATKKKSKKKRRKSRSGEEDQGPDSKLITRLEEVEALNRVQHSKLVPVLGEIMRKDPSRAVRTKAAEALQAQPKKDILKLANKLIQERDIRKTGSIAKPLIRILSYYGAKKSVWKDLYKRFLDLAPTAQDALMESVGERKDYDALPLLLAHLDPPQPVNVDDPSNPPASYWKARWEAWQAFKPSLKKALMALIGKSFETSREALEHIESQGGLKKIREKLGR